MYTMFEILEIEKSISSRVDAVQDSAADNLPHHMIFIDCDLNPCDELMYRSSPGCELIGKGIVSVIDDNLLTPNFLKSESDSNLDQMNYFRSNSIPRLYEQKLELFGSYEKSLVTLKNDTREDVVVEEMAVEEVTSELPNHYDFESEDNVCRIGFASKSYKQIRSSRCRSQKKFECHQCGGIFQRKKNLESHIRSHLTINNSGNTEYAKVIRPTKINGRKFKKKKVNLLEKRSKSSSSEISNLSGTYSNSDSLNEPSNHNARYECLYCDRAFLSYTSVAEHSRVEHGIHCDRFVCLYCRKQCKDVRGLQKHSKVHLDGELLLCNTCGKQFFTKNRLKRHMLSHRDKAVFCEECGEKTADHRALANHRSSHHVISLRGRTLTTRTFPCYACNKLFGSRSSQQIHMRIHTGERPYSCRYCVKAFADGGTLRKHERIHTGEKPYVCPVCQKAFNQRVVLREHIRAYHAGLNTAPSKSSFVCEVCSAVWSTSQELCTHLVKHSDDNTAKHRTTGSRPRKYKKWKQAGSNGSSVDGEAVRSQSNSAAFVRSTNSPKFRLLAGAERLEGGSDDESSFIVSSVTPSLLEKDDEELVSGASQYGGHSRSSYSSLGSSSSCGSGDHCSLFDDHRQIDELQSWKTIRSGDDPMAECKLYGDSSFGYQLLIPFDEKLHDDDDIDDGNDEEDDKRVAVPNTSCENSCSSSFSHTRCSLIEVEDEEELLAAATIDRCVL